MLVATRTPRAVVHCLLRRADEVLLIRLVESGSGRIAWRAPGGGIEWRESAEEAVRREVREEVGVTLSDCRLLEVIEAFGTWDGNEEHEVIFLFEAEPAEWRSLAGPNVLGIEANGKPLEMHWVRGGALMAEGQELYPAQLGVHIARESTSS